MATLSGNQFLEHEISDNYILEKYCDIILLMSGRIDLLNLNEQSACLLTSL